jgi:hypothetical protein
MKKSYGKFIQVLNRVLYIGSAAMLIAGTFLTMTPKMVSAVNGDQAGGKPDDPQITVCHSTGSSSNPYVEDTVDDDSIVSIDKKTGLCTPNGHGADEFDIIPSFITASEGCSFTAQGNQDYLLTHCNTPVRGCTNPAAFNYNPAANIDDGSCVAVIIGCMDPTAYNYDPTANTPGPCTPKIVGCMDPTAFNYDPTANTPGACIPVIEGCTNPDATNYNALANTDDGSCTFPPGDIPGCMNDKALNYNPAATVDDGSCIMPVPGCMNKDALNYNPAANVDDGSCIMPVPGCMNKDALNYNPAANVDDGSCIMPVPGCMNKDALNYNPAANVDDGSCIMPIPGCTDDSMKNYNPDANVDDGSCIPFIYGCMDPEADNYNAEANTDDQSCVYPIVGCMDPKATNYNELATVPDDSCVYEEITGCMDPAAANYDPNATISDPASCKYPGDPAEPLILGVNGYCTGGGEMQWTIENPNDYNLTVNSIVVDYGIPITGFSVTPGKHNLLTTPLGTHTVTIYYSDNGEATITNTMEVCPLFIPLLVPVTGGQPETLPGYGGGGDALIPVTGADETATAGLGFGLGGLSLAGLAMVLTSLRKLLHL